MSSSSDIYAFRRTPEGMAIENINVFKATYLDRYGFELSSQQIHSALEHRRDVRDFSAGGQAKNSTMLAAVCLEKLTERRDRVTASLVSRDPSSQLSCLILSLIPPMNDNKVCGYKRPNIHFKQEVVSGSGAQATAAAVAAANAAATADADARIRDIFTDCLGYSITPYVTKARAKGHVSQYVRSIVLQYFSHQPSSEQAMKDWTKHTTLLSVPDAPSVPEKVKSGRSDARVRQYWTEEQQQTVIQTLRRIQNFFGISWNILLRYLVEPIPDSIRDHFTTVVCLSIGTDLGFATTSSIDEPVVRGIAEALADGSFLDICFPNLSTFNPRTNMAQSVVLEEVFQEGRICLELYWQVCARLASSSAPVRPTKGNQAISAIHIWEQMYKRYPRLQSGALTIIDIELCDVDWLDGWPIRFMTMNIAQILGREHSFVQASLAQFAHRWTYDEKGDRIVDDRLGLYKDEGMDL